MSGRRHRERRRASRAAGGALPEVPFRVDVPYEELWQLGARAEEVLPLSVILMRCGRDGESQIDLETFMFWTKMGPAQVGRVLDGLERRGIVARRAVADGSGHAATLYRLTPHARELLARPFVAPDLGSPGGDVADGEQAGGDGDVPACRTA